MMNRAIRSLKNSNSFSFQLNQASFELRTRCQNNLMRHHVLFDGQVSNEEDEQIYFSSKRINSIRFTFSCYIIRIVHFISLFVDLRNVYSIRNQSLHLVIVNIPIVIKNNELQEKYRMGLLKMKCCLCLRFLLNWLKFGFLILGNNLY